MFFYWPWFWDEEPEWWTVLLGVLIGLGIVGALIWFGTHHADVDPTIVKIHQGPGVSCTHVERNIITCTTVAR